MNASAKANFKKLRLVAISVFPPDSISMKKVLYNSNRKNGGKRIMEI
jgi:hypothetical protein